MDDGFAREGVLTRCNQNRDETLNDAECINARRAAATIALQAERARAPELEQRSEAKLVALRDRSSQSESGSVGSASPAHEESLDASEGNELLGPHTIEIDVEPPSNDIVIAPPLVPELTVVPRPFRDDTAQR